MQSNFASMFIKLFILCLLVTVTCGAYLRGFEEDYPLLKKSRQLRSPAGSRNCFFSPINCVIKHDVSTYRRLAGSYN